MTMTKIRRAALSCGLCLAALSVTGPAQAHGPSRQKVKVERVISVDPDACWQVVGDFAALHSWLPSVDSSDIISGDAATAGAVRSVRVGDKSLEETLKSVSTEKRKLKYKISKENLEILPVNNYSSTLTVSAEGEGCKVTWLGAFYRGYPNGNPPEHLNDKAAIAAVTGLYNLGLDSLKAKLEQTH